MTQEEKIANDKLKIHLSKFGYEPAPITPGLWRHQTPPLQFSLVVDDFGVNMSAEQISPISYMHKKIYKISEYWDGKLYFGLNFDWDYYKRGFMVSMPNYVTKALHKFQNSTQRRAQYAPHKWTRPNYCATKQLANPLDTLPPISEERKRRIQK